MNCNINCRISRCKDHRTGDYTGDVVGVAIFASGEDVNQYRFPKVVPVGVVAKLNEDLVATRERLPEGRLVRISINETKTGLVANYRPERAWDELMAGAEYD